MEQAEDITLVDFDTEVRVARYRRSDYPRLIERIRGRKADGYDGALRRARRLSRRRRRPGRAEGPVLYTDGGDTRSTLTFSDVLDLLRRPTSRSTRRLPRAPVELRPHAAAHASSTRFAAMTGGQAFFPDQRQGTRQDVREDPARDRRALQPRLPLDRRRARTAPGAASRSSLKRPDLKGAKLRTRDGLLRPVQDSPAQLQLRAAWPTSATVRDRGPDRDRGSGVTACGTIF